MDESEQLTSTIPALSFRRYEGTTEPASYLHEPGICMVAQRVKRILLGEDDVYDAYHFLITSVDLQIMVCLQQACIMKFFSSRGTRREMKPPLNGMAVSEK